MAKPSTISRERWLSAAVGFWAVIVIVPLLVGGRPPAPQDAIGARLGEEAGAVSLKAGLARGIAGIYYDDGFYYLQIARHLAAGSGSTFDGLNPTNGYHPLWLLCLTLLAVLLPVPEDLLLASFALQVLLAAATTVGIYRLARCVMGPVGAAVAAVGWIRIQCTYWTSWAGMEYSLQALLIVWLLVQYAKGPRSKNVEPWLLQLGGIASLAFLARLDNLLLAGLLLASLLFAGRRDPGQPAAASYGIAIPERLRSAAWFAGPVILTVVAYVALNLWSFGHPAPVSGAVKQAWSADALAQDPRYQDHGWWVAKAWYAWTPLASASRSHAWSLLLGAFGGVAWIAVARRRTRKLEVLWPLAAFAALQYLAYVALYHGGFSFHPWYFVAQPLVTVLCAGWLIDRALPLVPQPAWRRWVVAALIVAILVSTAVNTARFRHQQGRFSEEPLYAAACWIRAHLPADARVGAWNAGILAFFSDRQVVNLDGLVNSWEYFLVESHDLCAYLEREGIDTLVDVFDASQPFAQYASQMNCAEQLEVIWTGPAYPGSSPLRRAMAFQRRWVENLGASEP
ncbi:MAG: hypothetical protein AAF560_10355 [Acidobacteriota bacterium]